MRVMSRVLGVVLMVLVSRGALAQQHVTNVSIPVEQLHKAGIKNINLRYPTQFAAGVNVYYSHGNKAVSGTANLPGVGVYRSGPYPAPSITGSYGAYWNYGTFPSTYRTSLQTAYFVPSTNYRRYVYGQPYPGPSLYSSSRLSTYPKVRYCPACGIVHH